ncbi:Protein-lysine N-methyltransferase rrg1 [Drechslerella dactyloides]|uniref:Protein-lysine N-methyltransferase rrg1 n=1 Tax=Drechslerella dactyloides TaxID=74499 RepID=A0AAD6IY30_DREDA|nr:Protein-lysine N-methyltransferase rrg1 [Drechslerella dactyloides]
MTAYSSSTLQPHSQPGSKLPIRSFTIPTREPERSIEIRIAEPQLRADGLGLETWASSYILSSLLRNFRVPFDDESRTPNDILRNANIPVLELGAGTGLVGLSAQAIWGVPVLLTDLQPIVAGLQTNIDLNPEISRGAVNPAAATVNYSARCGTLDWKSPSTLELGTGDCVYSSSTSKAHVILAADTVYSEEHPELLTRVIKSWLAPDPDSRVVIAYSMRVAYLDEIRDLWNRFEEAGLEVMQEGRETAQEGMFDDELLIEWSVWKWKTYQRMGT